jgi:Na+-translocating ferredoxin:NAD+ oxidoreductase RnfD subunit
MTAVVIRGTPYPVVLPKLRDPRLHLAATITSLQVIGQVGFHFRVSIAQILISLLTCAVIEVAIAVRRQHVFMWPASALLTGNGVAFVLRVPGTRHGDWWSTRGWWIFAATAAVSLLSKHVIQVRGGHIFNPSNIGLVLCFLLLPATKAEPLDFWWGPMSWWLVIAIAVILAGGFSILSRLSLLRVALSFWVAFATGIAILAIAGHEITARWHLGPIGGFELWWILVTSPEVLVFLFFMITDPKTAPAGPRARIGYGVSIGLLAALLAAPVHTEYWTKVALLGSLAVVCVAQTLLRELPRRLPVPSRRVLVPAVAVALAAYAAALVAATPAAPVEAAAPPMHGKLPPITILASHGVQTKLTLSVAQAIAHALVAQTGAHGDRLHLWLEPGEGQSPPLAVAQLAGRTYRLKQVGAVWTLATGSPAPTTVALPRVPVLHGYALANVARRVGLNFTQQSFRFGVTSDPTAMMGGGACWLDYDNDGWLDLFVVNNYTDSHYAEWQEHGGAPTGALFHNVHGHFVNVTGVSGLGVPMRGNGCVAADLNGDGRTDLFVTTATDDLLFWNNGDGTFTEGARKAGIVSFGWHTGAAVADVNGDDRPDLFVAGYTDMSQSIPTSVKGFPSNYEGVRDELFLNDGGGRFKDVGAQVGLDPKPYGHGLGAEFVDVNGDGRPDLYVANDEDPNALYLNEPGGKLGFHFVSAARAYRVADSNAGMGIAAADVTGDGRADLFVTNSRGQSNAAYASGNLRFTDVRSAFKLGVNPTGWGDAWVDLRNSGTDELVVANGAIPVTNVRKDAAPLQVFAHTGGRWLDSGLLRGLRVNGRGLAAADYDNDGRVDLAVNTVGGKLLLLHNTSPSGNWVEVQVEPFSPGSVVTAVSSDGRRQVRAVRAGSSYLSSEDPRVHFGFGPAHLRSLTVKFPNGTVKTVEHPPTNAIVTIER